SAVRTAARAAPIAANAPVVALSLFLWGRQRLNSATRTASPARNGTNVLTRLPAPYRAQPSIRLVFPPASPTAQHQEPAAAVNAPTKPTPARPSQAGFAL